MDSIVALIYDRCIHLSDQAEWWNHFGFKRKPQQRTLLSAFSPHWKLQLNQIIFQEMISVLSAAHIVAKWATVVDLDQLCFKYAMDRTFLRNSGLGTFERARQFLPFNISRYTNNSCSQWSTLLAVTFVPLPIPDLSTRANVLAGCDRFSNAAMALIDEISMSEIPQSSTNARPLFS